MNYRQITLLAALFLTLVLTLVLSSAPAETKKTADKLEPRFDTRLSALPSRGVVRSSEATVTPEPLPEPPKVNILKPAVPHTHPAPIPPQPPANTNEIIAYGHQRCVEVFGEDNWPALYRLWMQESGWNPYSLNPSSGAYGIPQSLPASKMASAGVDYLTNYKTQIEWGLSYIRGRYGSAINANNFALKNNYY